MDFSHSCYNEAICALHYRAIMPNFVLESEASLGPHCDISTMLFDRCSGGLCHCCRPHTLDGNIEGLLDNAGEIIGLHVNIFHFSFT